MPDLTSITPAQQNFSNVSGGGFVEVVPQTQVVLTKASIFILTGFGGGQRSKDMMRRSLRSGFGFVHGNVKQNCYGLRIFNFQPPQQCPVIVNQRQSVGQGGVDLCQGGVDLHQGGGVIKRAKSFSRPRSISPNPLRCFIPLLVIRRVKENLINIFLQTCVTGKTCCGSSSEP